MNKIIFPLKPGLRGVAVADLQDALQLCLAQGVVLANNEEARRELSAALKRERVEQTYGGATSKLVGIFQRERNLQPSGEVDEYTAGALNALLNEWGRLDSSLTPRAYVVSGRVHREDGLVLQDTRVRAFHEAERGAVRLGEDTTDAEGRYTIRYELLPGVESIHLRVTAIGEAGTPLQSSKIVRDAQPLETLDLTIPIAVKPAAQQRIEGRIVLEHGLPAEQVKLRLYRRDFGGITTLLDETTTLSGGQYAFTYNPGDKAVSLEVRAVKGVDEEVPLSKSLHNISEESRAIVNLIAPSVLQPLAPEYRRLSADLLSHVGQMANLAEARENNERQDLTVLNRATGWDARLIALAVTAERLSADPDVQLPPEFVYGLLRAGLPSDKLMLAQVELDVVEQALKTVRKAGIVDFNDQQIEAFKPQFTAFATQARLSIAAPGSRSTYGELLKASGLNEDAQAKFAPVYLNHRGDAARLWESARQAGLDETQIRTLQRQGKLAFLAGNSEPITTRLMKKAIDDPVQLVEHDFHLADSWIAEILGQAGIPSDRRDNLTEADQKTLEAIIPIAYTGEKTEDRLEAYAQDMARKVRLSYPTHVVGRLIEQDEIKLPAARDTTVTLMKKAAGQGFRLGETPVEVFFKTHTGVRDGLADNEFLIAQQQMKMLQRVYQITPSQEAMPVLISLGMTSAYDVMAYSEEAFLALYEKNYLDIHKKTPAKAQGRLIYRKSKQVSSVTYNLFTITKKLDSEPSIAGMSAPVEVRESVRNELIKQFPTLESLFGSMDFCECEHCRSVLSPAAYLVDLLQFVDAEPSVWGNFLAHWKATHNNQEYTTKYKKPYDALIERRPDLPHIPLTCENTHTALPYIDVVNEILEYYVANGKLEENAARDTGEATTAELLAEPQNVIREAYDKLLQARYPLNLPFDLWLETARCFCDYFETPLSRVLDVFRPSDNLFAPTQSYDLANIFMESLGLSPAESAIFIDRNPLAKWYELYGFATAAEATTEAIEAATGQRIDLNSAKALSRRLGVTYKEIAEIVQTEFVNPKLATLSVLYKLGISLYDARFYFDHKGLLGQDPATLSSDNQKKQLEVQAFAQELAKFAQTFQVTTVQLEADLQAIPFDKILVLADPDAGCNFDETTLRYADGTPVDAIVFLRINLFVRLWRKLGWSIEETDRALSRFIPQSAPFDKIPANLDKQPLQTALIYLAHLKALDERLSVGKHSRLKLITLWSDIATTGKKPLYAQLFLTRSVLKLAPVFDDPLGQYLSPAKVAAMAQSWTHQVQLENVAPADKIDPALFAAKPKVKLSYDALLEVQHLAYEGVLSDAEKIALRALSPSPALPPLLDAVQVKAQEFSLIKGHLPALQGTLGLTANEISRILIEAGKSLDTAELSLPNVSLLYRYGLLAKALALPVRELITLKQLCGLDPFKSLHPNPLTTLDEDYPFTQTLRFVEVAEEIKESGLKIEDLDYLLRHRFDETGKYRPNRESTLALLKTLAEGVRAIRIEHAVPDDPGAMSDETLRQKLGLVLSADVVATFAAMMNGTAPFTATRGVASADQLHPADFSGETSIVLLPYNNTKNQQTLVHRGVLFTPEKINLKNKFGGKLTAGQKAAFEALLDDTQTQAQQEALAFFNTHLLKQAAGIQPASGFLDAADYDLLFAPAPAGLTEVQQQARERQRRTRLAQAFLPFLQQRLIRQFIVQTMTAQTGADPVLVESLLADHRLLANPKSLLDAFSATAERGLTATFWASADGTGAPLPAISLVDADTGAKDKDGNPLKPAGAKSARLEGYLEVPVTGAYRFHIKLDKQNTEAQLRFPHLPEPVFLKGTAAAEPDTLGDQPNEYLELKAGVLYRFSLDLKHMNSGEARLRVQGETLPMGPMLQLTLYPAAVIDTAESTLTLLSKALQLVQSLGLSEREIRYLLTHAADFDNVSLSELPTATVGDTPAEKTATAQRFGRFQVLAAYVRLKSDLAGGTSDLIDIFEANGTSDVDKLDKKIYPLIAKLTRRTEATIKAAAKALFTTPAFAGEKPLQRLWEVLQVVERFGVPVASLLNWTRIVSPAVMPEQRFEIARDLKATIKARFEPEIWQRVAQPIFDKLRRRQRDALVAYVLHQQGFARLEQLYEYFLIDPGMEPVVQTSRIRLAIASLQLFIQRCLLNLELKVHPATINAKQWEWMKRYRVWEANRKIFLFPENWLEPEFRDDKTHLFAELEGALLQGDVSSDLVEDAFLNYLKKLDELARLDIVGLHIEDDPDPARRVLHVFGRTYSTPHKYFYRRYAHQMWIPWEPVNVEIEGDHLAPVVWRDRLYLFWVTFMDKPQSGSSDVTVDPTKAITIPAVKRDIEVQLHWSEYFQGEWSTRESGGFNASRPVIISGVSSFNRKGVFTHVSKEPYENGEERGVYIHLGGDISQSFYLAGRNSEPQQESYTANSPQGAKPKNPYDANTVRANRYAGSGALTVEFKQRLTTQPGKAPKEKIETLSILQQGGEHTLLPCNNNLTALGVTAEAYQGAANPDAVKAAIKSGLPEMAALMKPVFYQDNAHTLFVEPSVTEKTLEEWEEYVTRTLQPEPGWKKPDWWKEIVVIPKWPVKKPLPDPRDPWGVLIEDGSLINPVPGFDWLVNPGTGLLFDGVVIGPIGQPGLEIFTEPEGMAEKGTPVNVHPGSGVVSGSTVVLTGVATLEQNGLKATTGGLNIVGDSGFNAALTKNFNESNRAGFGDAMPRAGRAGH